MKLRTVITAATIGLAAYAATPVQIATAAPAQTETPAQVQVFWHYLWTLQHAPNTCGVVYMPDDPSRDHLIYGGSCLESFWYILTNYPNDPNVAFVWDVAS